MTVQPGDLRFFDEGTPIPVDVAATPIYVGPVGRSFDTSSAIAPNPFTASVDDLILTLSSGENSATLDLHDWLGRQTGTAFAPDRSRSISESRISFELNGISYLLVVTSAHFSSSEDGAVELRQFAGELFAER
jgi:hypothetical protein